MKGRMFSSVSVFLTLLSWNDGFSKKEMFANGEKDDIFPEGLENLMKKDDDEDNKYGDVEKLDTNNFEEYLNANTNVLVEFMSPWCGHCTTIIPEIKKAAEILKEKKAVSKIAVVDGSKSQQLMEDYDVEGTPTFLYFKDHSHGKIEKYEGQRTAQSIVEWLLRREGPIVKEIEGDVVEFMEKDNDVKKKKTIIAYVQKNSKKLAMIEKIAAEYEDDLFFVKYVTDPKESKIQVFRKPLEYTIEGEDPMLVYNQTKWKRVDITDLLKEADKHLILQDYAPDPSADVVKILFIDMPANDQKYQKYADMLLPFAKKYENELKFSFLSDREKTMVRKTMGVTDDDGGLLLFDFISPKGNDVDDESPMHKYKLPMPFSSTEVEKFLSDFKNGKLPLFIKSQPEPISHDTHVVEIVGSTAKKIILDPSKYVLVMYYAPWCPQCKKIQSTWVELATRVRKFDKKNRIVIARMDADNNDVFDHSVLKGYPTIVAYPMGTEKLKRKGIYAGDKSLDNLIDYVQSTYDAEQHEEL